MIGWFATADGVTAARHLRRQRCFGSWVPADLEAKLVDIAWTIAGTGEATSLP